MNKKRAIRLAEDNKHISIEEIKKDIADTQAEIIVMKREIKGFRLIGDRWSIFRADGRESGIKERLKFIEDLKAILEVRT